MVNLLNFCSQTSVSDSVQAAVPPLSDQQDCFGSCLLPATHQTQTSGREQPCGVQQCCEAACADAAAGRVKVLHTLPAIPSLGLAACKDLLPSPLWLVLVHYLQHGTLTFSFPLFPNFP